MPGRTKESAEVKMSLNDFYVIFSGMRGVRRSSIESIYNAGYHSIEKLQNATVEELSRLKDVGEKVAQKIITRAKEYNVGRVENFLQSIPRLRRDVIQEIVKRYPTRESLEQCTVEDLMEIKGVGKNLAQKILSAVKSEGKEGEGLGALELSYEEFYQLFRDLPGVSGTTLRILYENGFRSLEKLAQTEINELTRFRGIGEKTALRIQNRAKDLLETPPEKAERSSQLREILLSIPRLRRDTLENILERYPDVVSLQGVSKEELLKVKGVGEKVADKIIEAVQSYGTAPAEVPAEGAVTEEVAAEEEKAEEKKVEEKKEKRSSMEAILGGIKGVVGKIKGLLFPDKGKVKERVEEGESGGEVSAGDEGKRPERLEEIEGLSEELLEKLKKYGYRNVEELKEATVEDLIMIEGIDEETAKRILDSL